MTYADSRALERDYGFTPRIGIREGFRNFASINISTRLQAEQQKHFNAIVFYHSTDSDDNYSINSLPRMLYSKRSGLLENSILQTEYGIEENARKEISDIPMPAFTNQNYDKSIIYLPWHSSLTK